MRKVCILVCALCCPVAFAVCDDVDISIFNAGVETCRLVENSMPTGALIDGTQLPTTLEPGNTYHFSMSSNGIKQPADISLKYECGDYKPAKAFIITTKAWHTPSHCSSQLVTSQQSLNKAFPVTISQTHETAGYYTDICNEVHGKQMERGTVRWTVVP